jgi:outer membrane protein assembly factor BamB
MITFRDSPFKLHVLLLAAFPVLVALTTSVQSQIKSDWIARFDNGMPDRKHVPIAIAIDQMTGHILIGGVSTSLNADLDYLVLKYSVTGQLLWSVKFSSTNITNDDMSGFVVDKQGNSYVTGSSETVKVDANGKIVWTANYSARGIAVDDAGHSYVTGFSTVDFATAKLDEEGKAVWVQFHDVAKLTGDISQMVTLDSFGNVFVAGVVHWVEDVRGGAYQLQVVKYDAAGSPKWNIEFYPRASYANISEVKGLLTDSQGNVYLTCNYRGSPSPTYLTAKIAGDGTTIWTSWVTETTREGVTAMCLDEFGTSSCGAWKCCVFDVQGGKFWRDSLAFRLQRTNCWLS